MSLLIFSAGTLLVLLLESAVYVLYTRSAHPGAAKPNPSLVRAIRYVVGLTALTGLVAYLVMVGRVVVG